MHLYYEHKSINAAYEIIAVYSKIYKKHKYK
jgi:hypothetical protein